MNLKRGHRKCTQRTQIHRGAGNKKQRSSPTWVQSQEHTFLTQSEWTSHVCGHRLWTKKQKLDTVQSPLGLMLILILCSHATLKGHLLSLLIPLCLSVCLPIYLPIYPSSETVWFTSTCKHVRDAVVFRELKAQWIALHMLCQTGQLLK